MGTDVNDEGGKNIKCSFLYSWRKTYYSPISEDTGTIKKI